MSDPGASGPKRAWTPVRGRRTGPNPRYALASVVVHGLGIALAMGAAFAEPREPDFVSYQIELVSLGDGGGSELVIEAPPAAAPAPAEPAAPTPDPEPELEPEPEPEPEPTGSER